MALSGAVEMSTATRPLHCGSSATAEWSFAWTIVNPVYSSSGETRLPTTTSALTADELRYVERRVGFKRCVGVRGQLDNEEYRR
ncbi:hypothetical protein CPC08DRAFT_707208 [Agrocybe pediades]|nr:hypothetical protein CPC08DRAFT_707208 [Agrocybe pediades]